VGRRLRDPLHDDQAPCRRVTGVPATGIALPGTTILHFEGDRVVERFS
jgi:hypothetical protein